ncbi:Holliday junction branch migration protein RuvA [Actinomyces sp. oral taxon 897]|uniref:Holliday junction branch migration protein RuvA n=1 Tax=Actinomyces sp. oral taxon 897 TaxID=2081702 RepID=UPI000D03B7F5|nr:Holliday junction branch migration protein RuvA [Actinomyces sp. oral taxon 897]AVM61393.1 Holliday junction branch migration protein RuvA [Actinomyces sp. oral taxon 897]
MIASLHGTVLTLSLTDAVVECAGVGYRVLATPATLASLRVGEETRLHTELIVREDSQTLYGFSEADERDAFRVLLTAKGVGAKLALAMLAVHTPDALRRAVASQDVAALTRVPGLGPKGAQRVIIDVGDRLGPATGPAPARSEEPAAPPPAGANADVVAALVQLGWNEATATQAVAAVEAAYQEEPSAQEPSVPELLRASLRWLGGGRRG